MIHIIFRLFGIWVLVLVFTLFGEDARALVEKEKRIEKTYTVSDNTKIEISHGA